jgi:hypothetical protein
MNIFTNPQYFTSAGGRKESTKSGTLAIGKIDGVERRGVIKKSKEVGHLAGMC